MKRTKSKILLSILFLLAILSAVLLYKAFKPVGSLDKIKPDYTLNAEELFYDFDTNEEAATKKYVNKILLVKGSVKEILKNENYTIISLVTGDSFSIISCKLSENANNNLKIKKGDNISVKGECSGKLMDVNLINCSLINN